MADVHSHLPPERTVAQTPAPVLRYHVFVVELLGSGMSRETIARLQENPSAADFAEYLTHRRLCGHTSLGRATWRAAQAMWDVPGEPTVEALADLWQQVAVTKADPARLANVLDRCRVTTSLCARMTNPGPYPDPRLRWQMERYIWGQQPAAECLEALGATPSAADFEARYAEWIAAQLGPDGSSLAGGAPAVPWVETGAVALRVAMNGVRTQHPLPEHALSALLVAQARAQFAVSAETGAPLFLALGVESIDSWSTLSTVNYRPFLNWVMLTAQEFPQARVVLMNSNWNMEQLVCMAARQGPNIYVAGHWWQSLFGASTREQIRYRLSMVPRNKVLGFFSDAYCAEWIYARRLLLEEPLAQGLAEWVEAGHVTEAGALEIAAAWMHGNAEELLRG